MSDFGKTLVIDFLSSVIDSAAVRQGLCLWKSREKDPLLISLSQFLIRPNSVLDFTVPLVPCVLTPPSDH